MDHHHADPLRLFRLKPLRSARVSEISESTAASGVAPAERVNFHIGNPLQDTRLSSAYLRIMLGIDVRREDLSESSPEYILQHLGWTGADRHLLDLLIGLIRQSGPYLPRGGYARGNPPALIRLFCAWLEQQQESLSYDDGAKSGRREIVLASGGIRESLRILFHALSSYLAVRPARILLFRTPSDESLGIFEGLEFEEISPDERLARERVQQIVSADPEHPAFLVVGGLPGEEMRRGLRAVCLSHPLFFIEANDAPNHLSLARESRLTQHVLRFLTPGIFSPRLRHLSTVFVAGNADLLTVFESVHFQLKGTPSASEVEFLSFVIEHGLAPEDVPAGKADVERTPSFEGLGLGMTAEAKIPKYAQAAEQRLASLIDARGEAVERALDRFSGKAEHLVRHLRRPLHGAAFDETALMDGREFISEFIRRVDSPEWHDGLLMSYLSVFVKHNPQYRLQDCTVVSGSSRTALGLLGFHCGIAEVVVPDLSWSYEHCFPSIHAVPLTSGLELDVDAIVSAVESRIAADSAWIRRGAVVLNNPHNATGRVFHEDSMRRLLCRLLERGVFVIDDLSYQRVVPHDDLPDIRTLRQIADELVYLGAVSDEQAERVITVHSMSKTDCLAGARLSVVEIRERDVLSRFRRLNDFIRPNVAAVAISYLLYRQDIESVRAYWRLRNKLFEERTHALLEAMANLPHDRNPFGICIIPPTGSMYPLLSIRLLPPGLSLDWLASGLARQGIGMLPLATFARTEEGYETARRTFRLTLGGTDGADTLANKTRRVLIDLNRIVAEESANYNRRTPVCRPVVPDEQRSASLQLRWRAMEEQLARNWGGSARVRRLFANHGGAAGREYERFRNDYLPSRLARFRARLFDRAAVADELVRAAGADDGRTLARSLEKEFYKDDIERRREAFQLRICDRTVHPTQMYSIKAERKLETIISALIRGAGVPDSKVAEAAEELAREHLGLNVSITSGEEADEILLDLDSLIAAEQFAQLSTGTPLPSFLSFWGDWDGSNRPSGQGHLLAASVVMENVNRMVRITDLLQRSGGVSGIDPALLVELQRLPERNRRFAHLLDDITLLTHQLERRYRGVLPFSVQPNAFRRIGMTLHLTSDPLKALWQHNDRLERRMLELRGRRREMLEYYFALNKKLRKQLHASIPAICSRREHSGLLLEVSLYRDLLQRVIVTPRIQQSQVTAKDQFAIDTTVHNLFEINAIGAQYGNPGFVLGLQVSLSSKPEALISLDRKLAAQRDRMQRAHPAVALPSIWLIPLFEDLESVGTIPGYLGRLWDHALQSRRAGQDAKDRFAEMVPEIFVAGSDLCQQIGQPPGASLYRQAKQDVLLWLAEHGLAEKVRMKLGSGEPMQRQGGYYSPVAGEVAFSRAADAQRRFQACLPAAARQSTRYAVTPLLGIFSGGDLRTFQSNLAEQLRFLPVQELASVLHHVGEAQSHHRSSLIRAVESLAESRLRLKDRRTQELERLTFGAREPLYSEFLPVFTDCFRQILYGREEDVVGLHIISYFIARSMPQLRDRPTNRRSLGAGAERGQRILAGIAETIPLARQGSLLRAIAHNQAQTAVLGVNQLTTGLFRALDRYTQKAFAEGEKFTMLAERLLPYLPVYEILHSLRLYHDPGGEYVRRIEPALPAGNSAFVALREDSDAMRTFLPLVQQELLRRHGVDVGDFFVEGKIIRDLQPTLRPDLAVLLQSDLFNTSIDELLVGVTGRIADEWQVEVRRLLRLPEEIGTWRRRVWEILEESVFQRVQSFTELAAGLHTLSSGQPANPVPALSRTARLSPVMTGFLRTARADDEMRRFLMGAIEYLSAMSEGSVEVPVSIVRAMNEVERIAQIEEDVLPSGKRDLLRFFSLQIARLAGDNG
jgi:aspartate/methionine/tyrosine aminotransferase